MAEANGNSSDKGPSDKRILSDLLMRINQAHGLVDVIGNLDLETNTLDVNSLNNASWAAKSLLSEARSLTERLYHVAIMADEEQAESVS